MLHIQGDKLLEASFWYMNSCFIMFSFPYPPTQFPQPHFVLCLIFYYCNCSLLQEYLTVEGQFLLIMTHPWWIALAQPGYILPLLNLCISKQFNFLFCMPPWATVEPTGVFPYESHALKNPYKTLIWGWGICSCLDGALQSSTFIDRGQPLFKAIHSLFFLFSWTSWHVAS